MATLTETAHIARNVFKYGGVGVLGFIFLQWAVSTGIRAYIAAHPPYVAPTMRYRKLPKMQFPAKTFVAKKLTLELPNDAFPKMSDQAKVYVVYSPVNNLLALDVDRQTAKTMGFTTQGTEIRTGVYRWANQLTSQQLTMNVLDGSFEMKYPYENDQLLQNPRTIPSKNEATTLATSYLTNINKMSPDLAEGTKKVSYWKVGFGGLKAAASESDANIIKVDFFRKETDDNLKILPENPNTASVSILVSGSDVDFKKIVYVSYRYSPIDRQSFSTYPIKTPQQAWEQFKGGNYWPAAEASGSSTIIRKIYLAYFEPATLTNFMQPIYVAEGDNNFVGYIPAVADSAVASN